LKRFELIIGEVFRPVLVLCHLVYLIFGFSIFLHAQSRNEKISEKLIHNGFENVAVINVNDTLNICFENRIYRFNPRGIAKAVDLISSAGEADIVNLFPLVNGVKVLRLQLNLDVYKSFVNGEITEEEFFQTIHATLNLSDNSIHQEFLNKSNFKADVAIIPTWSAKFGDFNNPVESNINLIPELNTTLAQGLSFKAQLVIPIQNDHFFVAERKTIRPGNITLNQFTALDDNFYFNLTAGFFDKNRAGGSVELYKVFFEGSFELGANIGFTGYYSFTGITTEFYDKSKYLTALVLAQYRYKPYDLVGRLIVGNHLYNVFATRFEVMRQFGEVQIGFFAMKSNDDYDAGFNFRLPLPPAKYGKIKWLRLRPSESFRWEYRAKGFPQNGVTVNTGFSLNQVLLDNNPDFIKKRLIIEIKNKKY